MTSVMVMLRCWCLRFQWSTPAEISTHIQVFLEAVGILCPTDILVNGSLILELFFII